MTGSKATQYRFRPASHKLVLIDRVKRDLVRLETTICVGGSGHRPELRKHGNPHSVGHLQTASGAKRTVRIVDLDAERSIVKLEFSTQMFAYVPLTFVSAVWLDENDQTNIDVHGTLKGTGTHSGPRFVPPGCVA